MAKLIRKKKTVKKKTKKRKVVIKTVKPVSTPVGSVHFDEFLKACKEPSLPLNDTKPVKKKKKKKTKRNVKTKMLKKTIRTKKKKKGSKKKMLKKKKIVKPKGVGQNETGSTYPTLFPLIKALLQPTEGDPFQENDVFSEFVVGKTDPPVLKRRGSMREKNLLEQEANDIIDEINKVQEKIKTLMQKPQLNQSETVALVDQQTFLMSLLDNFENCLARIQGVLNAGPAENANEDDDNWLDVDEGEETRKKQRAKCDIADNAVESHDTNGAKWYDGTDLAYLLSPNTSFDKKRSLSSDILNIFEEFRTTKAKQSTLKRNDLFNRLKNKFNILLPPLKMKRADENLIWLEKKFYKDHQEMLNSTKDLKLFQCWNQLELQYNMISALIISLKDVIKSTPPFYYANSSVKSQFVDDQSRLVQALDEIKRKTKDTFLRVGLEDYWRILPESMKLGAAKPCFEITIRQNTVNDDNAVAADEPEITALLLRRRDSSSSVTEDADNSTNVAKNRSKYSEVEVRNIHYTL